MGVWGSGLIDNDMAYEILEEIEEDASGFFINAFETALESDYLEIDEAYAVMISCVYLDNYFNATTYSHEYDGDIFMRINQFQYYYTGGSLDYLKPLAIEALKRVLGENSEIDELWKDAGEDYENWKKKILDLINRLSK